MQALRRNVGKLFNRGFVQVALGLQQSRQLGVGAGHLDHVAHLEHRVDVGFFEVALMHLGGRGRLRRGAFACRINLIGEAFS